MNGIAIAYFFLPNGPLTTSMSALVIIMEHRSRLLRSPFVRRLLVWGQIDQSDCFLLGINLNALLYPIP